MHTYTQHERERLLMSLLDIYQSAFIEVIKSDRGDAVIDELTKYGIDGHLSQYITEMSNGDGQVMFQAVASMSDQSIHHIVDIFGQSDFSFLWCGHAPYKSHRCAEMSCENYASKHND